MARQTLTKRAYCKSAVFLNTSDRQSLQAKLAEALEQLRTVGQRKEEQGDNRHAYVRTVIYHRLLGDMLFGILASYERGTHLLTVAEDDQAEVLTVEEVAPPKTQQDRRREFLEGTCYFGVSRNQVVLVASRALGAKAAEQHFDWLMAQAGTLGEGNRLALSNQVTQATRERIEAAHVKEVQIGAPLLKANAAPAADTGQAAATVLSGLGLDMLRQVLGHEALDRLRLADAVDGNIEVSLKVRYKRSTHAKAQKLLDHIALAVRNLDADEVKLTLDGGGTVKGDELKLSTLLHVQGHDGIPDPEKLFEKMRGWLIELLENRVIEP